jgi:hypothetical protein
MHPFREKTPKRRENAKEREKYSSHRNDLREDFNKRCGYCDDTDYFKVRLFTIDHFVPQNPKDFKHEIESNFYYNLVWACNFCNSAKSNKWFTKTHAAHNDGKSGFIEPTNEEYTILFRRDKDGSIESNGINNDLAEHIKTELNLIHGVHRITWKLEKLYFQKLRLENELESPLGKELGLEIRNALDEILMEFGKLFLNLISEVNE